MMHDCMTFFHWTHGYYVIVVKNYLNIERENNPLAGNE